MKDSSESETFCCGISVGMALYQRKVLIAHEKKVPLEINGESYFIKDGNELLKEMINEICK